MAMYCYITLGYNVDILHTAVDRSDRRLGQDSPLGGDYIRDWYERVIVPYCGYVIMHLCEILTQIYLTDVLVRIRH